MLYVFADKSRIIPLKNQILDTINDMDISSTAIREEVQLSIFPFVWENTCPSDLIREWNRDSKSTGQYSQLPLQGGQVVVKWPLNSEPEGYNETHFVNKVFMSPWYESTLISLDCFPLRYHILCIKASSLPDIRIPEQPQNSSNTPDFLGPRFPSALSGSILSFNTTHRLPSTQYTHNTRAQNCTKVS